MIRSVHIAADPCRIVVQWTTTNPAEVCVTLSRNGTGYEQQTFPQVKTAEPLSAIFQSVPPEGVYIMRIAQNDSRKLLDVPRWPAAGQP